MNDETARLPLVYDLDGSEAPTIARLYAVIARDWGLPAHFGHNLDALADVLVDLGRATGTEAERSVLITLSHAEDLLVDEPERRAVLARLVTSVVAARRASRHPLHVLVL